MRAVSHLSGTAWWGICRTSKRIMSTSHPKSLSQIKGWHKSLPLCFGVSSQNVEVVSEPSAMYDRIIQLIKSSKRRIGMASLYLGNGKLEIEMVSHLKDALESNPNLQTHILLDFTRGSRGENNSRTMLLPCLREHSNQMTLSLYHTPNLKGLMKRFLPDRFNELLGLQHMKAYIFDDTLMLSGANLSHDYFTNRQDRCIVIKDSAELCDYFYSLMETVSKISYQVDGKDKATLSRDCVGSPTTYSGTSKFIKHASTRINSFIASNTTSMNCCDKPDTWVYPLIQMGSFNVTQEQEAMKTFLLAGDSSDRTYISTAYFNPSSEYTDLITTRCQGEYHMLTASPQANGFLNAKGVAGYIPMGYRWYEKVFLNNISKFAQSHRIKLYEYTRPGWTFHSKGLWYYPAGASLPSLTVIGSSNFGYRSIHLDLEAQMVLTTENKELQRSLHTEKENLYSQSEVVDTEILAGKTDKMPLWTRLVAILCRHYF